MRRVYYVHIIGGIDEEEYRKMQRKRILKLVGLLILMVIVLVGSIFYFSLFSFNDHQYTGTVTKQERIVEGRRSYYLIFVIDENGIYREFKNEDDMLRGKFNSSRIYNQITVGETYEFTVVGYRIEWLSEYENIIGLKKVE